MVVMATVCLHNFLRDYQLCASGDEIDKHVNDAVEDIDKENENQNGQLRKRNGKRGRNEAGAKKLRDQLANYFIDSSSVGWQWKAAVLSNGE